METPSSEIGILRKVVSEWGVNKARAIFWSTDEFQLQRGENDSREQEEWMEWVNMK